MSPAPEARNVSPDITLAATFSDFPEPETVSSANILLYTGFYYHTGQFWVDLVGRRALFKTSGDLRMGLGYTFVVKPAIRSLRGCRLLPPSSLSGDDQREVYDFRFQVVGPDVERPPTPLPAPPTTYQQVVRIFAAHCAGGGCHLTEGPGPSPVTVCLPTPGGGLSLCEAEAHAALFGVPSRQVRPLVLVAPNDASRSYLLRKIIGAPPVVGHSGVPNDNLSQADKYLVQDWIDRGAPPADIALP